MKQQECILSQSRRSEVRSHTGGWGALPPESLGEGPSCLFRPPVAPGVPGLVTTPLQPLPPSSRGFSRVSSLCLPLVRTLVVGFRAPQIIQEDLISRSLITSANTLFPSKVAPAGSGASDMDSFGGRPPALLCIMGPVASVSCESQALAQAQVLRVRGHRVSAVSGAFIRHSPQQQLLRSQAGAPWAPLPSAALHPTPRSSGEGRDPGPPFLSQAPL